MTSLGPKDEDSVGQWWSHCRPGAGAGSKSGTQVPKPMWDRGAGLSHNSLAFCW